MRLINKFKSFFNEAAVVSRRISKENNLNMFKIYVDILFCALRYSASPNNYELFEFYCLDNKKRKTYVTYGVSQKMIKKYNNTSDIVFLENKIKFAEKFVDMYNRDFLNTESMTIDEFKKFCEGKEKFICKPVGGAQGNDIKVYHLGNVEEIFSEIKHKYCRGYMLEQWIEQHPVLSEIYPDAVNCLRVITVFNGEKTHFLVGGITFSLSTEIANGSQPSIIAPVNFETGIIDKPAATFGSQSFEKHPKTGSQILGVKVPYWDDIKELLNTACQRIPTVGYIGWDVAITPDGPVLIEGNTTPGYRYYQIPCHMINGFGNKPIYSKFL